MKILHKQALKNNRDVDKLIKQMRDILYPANPFKFGSRDYKTWNIGVNMTLDVFEIGFKRTMR